MSGWHLEVLSTKGKDRERWKRCIEKLPSSKKDVFFLPEYAELYENVYGEPAALYWYGNDHDQVLMVAAKRSICNLEFFRSHRKEESTAYSDIATPYGYGGPTVYCDDLEKTEELFTGFREALHQYCCRASIVAEFLRLHPLMQNHQLFHQDPGLRQGGDTVWIDLRQSDDQVLQSMHKNHRRNIRQAASKGVEIIKSDLCLQDLKEFHRLYNSRMETLEALPVFSLPLEFFQKMASNLPEHVALFFARWEGKVVSAYLLLGGGDYIHHFLSGSDQEHWDLKANVLTVYKAVLWAKAQGYRYYHLGGGHAVRMDSVFKFKSQFSSSTSPYYMYQTVHDQAAYQRLCRMKREYEAQKPCALPVSSEEDPWLTDYFPAYRA